MHSKMDVGAETADDARVVAPNSRRLSRKNKARFLLHKTDDSSIRNHDFPRENDVSSLENHWFCIKEWSKDGHKMMNLKALSCSSILGHYTNGITIFKADHVLLGLAVITFFSDFALHGTFFR